MKKLLLTILMLLSVIVTCGCASDENAAKELQKRLNVPFEYTVKSENYVFTYKKEADRATIDVTEPESLAGLRLEKNADGVNASYDGIVVTLPSRAAKRLFTLDDIVNSFAKSLSDGTFVCDSADGVITFGASSGLYAYSITVNKKTGDIVEMKAENGTEEYVYTFLQ